MAMEKTDVTSITYLKDTFQIGYNQFEDSRLEAQVAWDMYHNRHYTADQEAVLAIRGQPAETFNIIKLFSRLLLGYYSTVINTVQVSPVGMEDVPTASLLNDIIDHAMRDNNFVVEGEKVKLSGIIAGLMCVYLQVVPTGQKDEFGRALYKLSIEHVPENELVLDPMSRKDDYTDARFIHRFKWVSEEQLVKLVGQAKVNKLEEYYNFTNKADADHDRDGWEREVGIYRVHNNYLLVHSIVHDAKGKTWSILWNDDHQLTKTEITHKKVQNPYRVVKIHTSNRAEYYGIFREVLETQKAMNQALIKLQLLVNTQKAFIQDGAVEDIADFTNAFNRVTAVIPVTDLSGIKIETLSREAMEQYQLIDKALDRVQRVLGINDSFLGMAFASDSGRKVQLQKNASVMGLRYLTGRLEAFYRFLGWDMIHLIKQYYTSHQLIRIADDATGERWIEINKPMQSFTGEMDENNQPIMRTEFEESLDPETGKPAVDENGNFIIAPIPEDGTELSVSNIDISVDSTSYNDEDEKNQLVMETILNGATGQLLSQVNPAGFFKIVGLSMKSVKTKNSPEIARIFEETAQMLGQSPEATAEAKGQAGAIPGQQSQQPKSPSLQIPQGG